MNWKKKIEKSTIYLLVSLVTFILYVFSYVPLYVIYLYIYTYVHTLSLRITSLFFLCFPCSVIIFCLCLCLFIYIYLRLILFSLIPYVFLLFYYPYNQCFRFSYVANYILPVFDHNLAYSTHFYIFPNLLYSVFNRLSVVFFVFSFYHFLIFLAQSFFFLFFFFLYLSILSIYLRIVCHFWPDGCRL